MPMAAAVLMAIAARLDGESLPVERQVICRLLERDFQLEDAARVVEAAEEEARASTDFYGVTRILKDRLSPEERETIIEMLWEVAYADGEVDDYEANLIRRVAGLLYVPDREAGEARKRVLERISAGDA